MKTYAFKTPGADHLITCEAESYIEAYWWVRHNGERGQRFVRVRAEVDPSRRAVFVGEAAVLRPVTRGELEAAATEEEPTDRYLQACEEAVNRDRTVALHTPEQFNDPHVPGTGPIIITRDTALAALDEHDLACGGGDDDHWGADDDGW